LPVSHLRKVHRSIWTEKQDSVGNSNTTQGITPDPLAIKEMVVNFSSWLLDDAACSTLCKGLNYVVSTVVCISLFPKSLTPILVLCLPFSTRYWSLITAFFRALTFYVRMSTPWCLPVMFSSSPFFNIAPF
jgi:hypothetical protein